MKKTSTNPAAFSIMKKCFLVLALMFMFYGLSVTSLNAQISYTYNFAKDLRSFIVSKSIMPNTYEKIDSIKKPSQKDLIPLKDINFKFIVGLSDGTDYSTNITTAFQNNDRSLSGFKGWLNVGVGLEFKTVDMLYVSTSFEGRFSRIAVTDMFTNSTSTRYINALYSLGLGGTYYFPIGKSLLYLNSEVLGNFAGSDSDLEKKYDFNYETDGAGFKITAGWRIATGKTNSYGLEFGYSSLPVSLIPQASYQQFYPNTKKETKNFGGIFFNICGNLGLGNY